LCHERITSYVVNNPCSPLEYLLNNHVKQILITYAITSSDSPSLQTFKYARHEQSAEMCIRKSIVYVKCGHNETVYEVFHSMNTGNHPNLCLFYKRKDTRLDELCSWCKGPDEAPLNWYFRGKSRIDTIVIS
jgi:hypothetical protein